MYPEEHNILIPPIHSIKPQSCHTLPLNQSQLNIHPLPSVTYKILEAAKRPHFTTISIY